MAQKRMFNKTLTNSDEFLDLPDSTQVLYFHLSMNADDEGFVNNWKSIIRMTGTKEDDLKLLIAKSFIIPFDSGVIVIRHWKLNNYLQNDRIKATQYQNELKLLSKDDNGVYNLYTKCIHSIDKNSIVENSIVKSNKEENEKEEKVKIEKKYFESIKVNTIFNEFLDLRKKLKAVNTDRAINMLINKLNEYDEETQYEMIEQSIINSWKGIFELKNKTKKKDNFMDTLKEIYSNEQDRNN